MYAPVVNLGVIPRHKKRRNTTIEESFPTPNNIVDELMPLLSPESYMLLSFAVRDILGFESKRRTRRGLISISRFMTYTGLARKTVIKALKPLMDCKVLIPIGRPTDDGQEWQINYLPEHGIDFDCLRLKRDEARYKNRARTEKARTAVNSKRIGVSDTPAVCVTHQRSTTHTAIGVSDTHIESKDQSKNTNTLSPQAAGEPLMKVVERPIEPTKTNGSVPSKKKETAKKKPTPPKASAYGNTDLFNQLGRTLFKAEDQADINAVGGRIGPIREALVDHVLAKRKEPDLSPEAMADLIRYVTLFGDWWDSVKGIDRPQHPGSFMPAWIEAVQEQFKFTKPGVNGAPSDDDYVEVQVDNGRGGWENRRVHKSLLPTLAWRAIQ
jgi:hypothetical protein